MHRTLHYFTIVLLLFSACNTAETNSRKDSTKEQELATSYAKNFSLDYRDDSVFIHTGTTNNTPQQKAFAFPQGSTPKKILCLSTTHLPFITSLGREDLIVGVSALTYVYNKEVLNNDIVEVGYETNMDFESIIKMQPDLVLAYSIQGESASHIRKLQQLQIPVLLINEYLENHPLGRSEWIKVFGALLGEEEKADSLFNEIMEAYHAIKNKAKEKQTRPGVLVGLPFKGVWHMPGGDSYFATMIEDAGGDFIFKTASNQQESVIVPFEKILQKRHKADIWIHTGTLSQIDEILTSDPRLTHIPALTSGQVFNNNARLSASGGSDFWESGIMNPHLILQDLYQLFHHHNHPSRSSELFYYRQLQ